MTFPGAPGANSAARSAAADTFARVGRVRLQPALGDGDAQRLYSYLESEAAWSRVFNQGEQVWDLGPDSIVALAQDNKAETLLEAVNAGAKAGFQFLYDAVRVSDEPADRAARGWLVDRLLDAFNSEAWLSLFREITGEPAIRMVDGQATRYLPGHFLTGHDDAVAGKDRVAAYVLSLTPHWRTEWGGLLLFHSANGDVAHGLAPQFNALHLFAVPQLHSVSQVTGFAGAPRYSLTGWLRR